MTVEPLLAQLAQGAEEEAARRLTTAREQAARLQHEAAVRIAHRRAAALAERTRVLDARAESRRAEGAREHAEAINASRSALVDRVLSEARRHVPDLLSHPRLLEALAADLAASVACLPDGGGRLRVAPALVPLVRGLVESAGWCELLELCEEADAPPGVRVDSADGRVRVDASWLRRLETERDALAIEIVRAVEREP